MGESYCTKFECNTLTVQGISPFKASFTRVWEKNVTARSHLPLVKSLPCGFPSLTPLGVASTISVLFRVKEEAPGPEARGSQTHEEANTTRCPFQAGQKSHSGVRTQEWEALRWWLHGV